MTAAPADSSQKGVVRRLIDDVMNAQRLDVADELSSCLVWQVEGLSR